MKRTSAKLLSLLAALALALPAVAQTFRGGINGAVTDATGAAVAGAKVAATETSTGIVHESVSS